MGTTTTTKQPVFCPRCRTANTFIREPDKDVVIGETVGWERWTCRPCKYVAILPTEVVNGVSEDKGQAPNPFQPGAKA